MVVSQRNIFYQNEDSVTAKFRSTSPDLSAAISFREIPMKNKKNLQSSNVHGFIHTLYTGES